MALSDDQIVNIWGIEPRYHAAPIGSTDIAFARDIEAEIRKQDEALIRQMDAALDASEAFLLSAGFESSDAFQEVSAALTAGRAWLEAKK